MKKQLFLFALIICGIANAQNTWTVKNPFGGTGRYTAVGFSIGTKGYIGTGSPDGATARVDFWEWNQTTNAWTQKASFGGGARFDGVGFSIGNKGYIGLGTTNAGNALDDLWEYDPTLDTWTQKTNLPAPGRRLAVAFTIGNKGYVSMGTNAGLNIFYNDLWEYNPSADTVSGSPWVQRASYPGSGRASAFCFSIGTKGYIGTGTDWSTTFGDFKEWNQSTDTWTSKANFGARYGAVGFSIAGKGYAGTGFPGPTVDFREYDPATDVWTQRANFGGVPRVYPVGFSVGNNGYIGTGFDPTPYLDYTDFWEYSPVNVGIHEVPNEIKISVYPNPSYGKFILNSEITKGEIEIYNSMGEKIYISEIISKETEIDLSGKAKGVYFIKIQTKDQVFAQKVILE